MALEFDVWNQWCSEESMLDWTVPYKWMVYVMHDMYVKQLYTPYAVGWSKSEINSTYVYCSWDITLISVSELPSMYCLQMLSLVSTELCSSYLHQHFVKDLQVVYIHRIYHCKSICYFDNCNCYQNCNCGLEIVPCGSQLWQYNTHGVQEQLMLLEGLGSLLRHQISAIHNKDPCHVNCSTYTYLWPV